MCRQVLTTFRSMYSSTSELQTLQLPFSSHTLRYLLICLCLQEALGRDPHSFPSSASQKVMVTRQIYTTAFYTYIYADCQKTVNTYLIFIVLVSKLLLLLSLQFPSTLGMSFTFFFLHQYLNNFY